MTRVDIAPLSSTQDLPGCVEVFQRAFAEPPWNETWPESVVDQRLREIIDTPGSVGVVARSEGDVTGFILGFVESFYPADRFQLAEMAVSPDHQRGGVGTALVRGLDNMLQEKGVAQIYLVTEPRGSTRAFWDSQDFRASRGRVVMARAPCTDD